MTTFVWSQDFQKRTNEAVLVTEYLRQWKERLKLDDISSCAVASVSAPDIPQCLLKDCLPKVQKFFCLSISRDTLEILNKDIQDERKKRRGGLEVRLKVQRVEAWAGPGVKIDAIFLANVNPRMTDYELPGFFRRCVDWLNMSGVLFVLFHEGPDTWNDALKKLAPWVLSPLYERVKRGLRRAGIEVVEEKTFDVTLSTKNLSKTLLNYFIQRPSTDKEFTKFAQKIAEVYPDEQVEFFTHLLICRRK
jgi:hypothetical protein